MAIMINGKTLFEAIGGRPVLEKVHKVFYDKVYAHPWIGKYFQDIKQEFIESQQTDFMSDIMGGPKVYFGKMPAPAHKHMFITEDLFILREAMLREALVEVGVSAQLIEEWLKIDAAFKKGILKNSPADCVQRYATEPILNFPNPDDASGLSSPTFLHKKSG